MSIPSSLETALKYAAYGWSILPLRARRKEPATSHGLHDATRDERAIREWWGNGSAYNVGVATGEVSRIVVIDIDGPEGAESWKALCGEHGEVVTLKQKTGRADGGWQLVFRHPGEAVRNRAAIRPGIDVRGDGGYVVVPPSIHPTGGVYSWVDRSPIAEMPEWLVALVVKQPEQRRAAGAGGGNGKAMRRVTPGNSSAYGLAGLAAECDEVAGSGEGGRNDRLNRAAYSVGQLVGGGELERGHAEADLLDAALRCGLGEREATKTLRSGLDSGEKDPRTAPVRKDGWVEGRAPEFADVPRHTDEDAPAEVRGGNWRDLLMKNQDGGIKSCGPNALIFVRHHPELKGRVGLNERTQRPCWVKPPPWGRSGVAMRQLAESDADEMSLWVAETCWLVIGRDHCWRAMCAEAEKNPYDALREWLKALEWDGTDRLSSWLTTRCGVLDDDYMTAVGRAWMVSAAARVLVPGCQVDHMLVFEGVQGAGKTSVLRELAGDRWYAEITVSDAKDSAMAVHGPWVVEWAELSGITKRDAETVKAFISRRVDHIRLPYGRTVLDIPRRCVFAGTTNEDTWQTDATGGRRYWPVKVGVCDVAGIQRDREQLWAEAVAAYQGGERWWLSGARQAEAAELQEARYEGDPWEEKIRDSLYRGKLMGRPRVSLGDIVLDALDLPVASQTSGTGRRVARMMRRLGWEKAQWREDGDRLRGYSRPQLFGNDTDE